MGSNVKGKNTAAPHSVKPGSSTPPISTHVNKSVKYGDPPPGDHRKFYTPPSSPKANIIFSEGPDWSTMGNASGAQDDMCDYCPWDEQELGYFYEMANCEQEFQVDTSQLLLRGADTMVSLYNTT